MKRLFSKYDCKFYTYFKQVLYNLDLADKDYLWVISDMEAVTTSDELCERMDTNEYSILYTTKELLELLEIDDAQWIWGVFSAIPAKYANEDLLDVDLPYIQFFEEGKYNPVDDEPKLQHPFAEFEIYSVDSSFMFMIADDDNIVDKFKKAYPKYIEDYLPDDFFKIN